MKKTNIPYLSGGTLKQVDLWMVSEYHISITQMMELAGLDVALQARAELKNLVDAAIVMVCGKGNNGGDGLVAARHLANWGARVSVILSGPETDLTGHPAEQLKRLKKLPVPITVYQTDKAAAIQQKLSRAQLVIDGVLGFGITGAPRQASAALIEWMNTAGSPILAIDTPSGLDASNGTVYHPCVKADVTLTLGLPKSGFLSDQAKAMIGRVFLGDIGIPPQLIKDKLGYDVGALFSDSTLIHIH